jgi:hypothetical protein
LARQLRKTWITEAYLCSARVEGGHVRALSERTCAHDYLLRQLRLLRDRAIVALGGKRSGACTHSTDRFWPHGRQHRPDAIDTKRVSHGRRSRSTCAEAAQAAGRSHRGAGNGAHPGFAA